MLALHSMSSFILGAIFFSWKGENMGEWRAKVSIPPPPLAVEARRNLPQDNYGYYSI